MKQEVGSVQLVSHSPLKVQSGMYGETFIFAGCWIMNEDTGSLGWILLMSLTSLR